MPNEPLLTRKSYKEQLERQKERQKEIEKHEIRKERRESQLPFEEREEGCKTSHEEENLKAHRTPSFGLRKYNHFLNVWLVSIIFVLIVVICIQLFL